MSRLLMRVAVERRALDAAVSRLRSAAGAARKRARQTGPIASEDKPPRMNPFVPAQAGAQYQDRPG